MSRLEQIQEMLADTPNDVFLNFALAMEYVKTGRLDEAVVQFTRVVELDPNHIAAYAQRANVLINLGRKDEAKSVLTDGMAAAERAGDAHAADRMRQSRMLL